MKTTTLSIAMILLLSVEHGFAQDSNNNIDVSISVYPKSISYGDVFFLLVTIANNSENDLKFAMHSERSELNRTLQYGYLRLHDKELYDWKNATSLDMHEGRSHGPEPIYRIEREFFNVASGSKEILCLRCMWLPMPEFSQLHFTKDIQNEIEKDNGKCKFEIEYFLGHDFGTPKPDNRSAVKRWSATTEIVVNSRPHIEIEMLKEWYFEIPSTRNKDYWSMDGIWAHPYYVRNSPYKKQMVPHAASQFVRYEFKDSYDRFFKMMEMRNSPMKERIARTKELEFELLERSDRKNSTLSQNMVEFIRLRGFLVEMRYAVDENAEKKAFIDMCDWIENSHDKKLWVEFTFRIALPSIFNKEYFPIDKVEYYCDLFASQFEIEKEFRAIPFK